MRALLNQRYPQLNVKGRQHPISPQNFFFSRIFMMIQLSLIAIILGGDSILQALGLNHVRENQLFKDLQTNKLGSCFMIWMVGNMFVSGLANTGAFEIAYDGQMVFSKLDAGRMPSVPEIMGGIEQIMKNAQ